MVLPTPNGDDAANSLVSALRYLRIAQRVTRRGNIDSQRTF